MNQRVIVLLSSIALLFLGFYGLNLFLTGQVNVFYAIFPFALCAFSFYVYFTKR